jgi:4-amino-4-deoxy-L-arabinose transferase-like glycosyltransferase
MKREVGARPAASRSMFSRFAFLLILIAAVVQFCLYLNRHDVTTAHEGRVMVTAREMLASGEWVVPHSNGKVRLQKPPLPYWATAAMWKASDRVEPWLARLPAAACGAVATVLVMSLARQTLGRTAGVIAGGIWVSTWFVVDEFRKAMADPYLAFFTLLAVWAWVTADQIGRRNARARASSFLILLAYVGAGLGVLAKGPIIFLHLAIALVSYHVIYRRRPQHFVAHGVGIILLVAISLPWPIEVSRRLPDAIAIWRHEIKGESATSGAKTSPVWHYFAALPLTAAPWTVFAVIGILIPILSKRRRDRRLRWPLAWLGATVLVFSFVPMKKNAYLLPVMPAQALLIAGAIATVLAPRRGKPHGEPTDRLIVAGHAVAAGTALCVMLFLVLKLPELGLEPPGPLLAACGVGIFLIVGCKSMSERLLSPRTIALTAAGFALAVHGVVAWLDPDRDNRESPVSFASAAVEGGQGLPLHVIGPGLREDVLFYLGRTVPVVPSLDDLPADYRGDAIVTADAMPAVRLADRGDLLAESADRSAKDKLYLVRFPKDPSRLLQQERR